MLTSRSWHKEPMEECTWKHSAHEKWGDNLFQGNIGLITGKYGNIQICFFKNVYSFWEREREREREGECARVWGRDRDRGRARIPSWLHTQREVQHGAWSHHWEIMTWAKIKSQTLNWLSTQAPWEALKFELGGSIVCWRCTQTFAPDCPGPNLDSGYEQCDQRRLL